MSFPPSLVARGGSRRAKSSDAWWVCVSMHLRGLCYLSARCREPWVRADFVAWRGALATQPCFSEDRSVEEVT